MLETECFLTKQLQIHTSLRIFSFNVQKSVLDHNRGSADAWKCLEIF